MSAADDQHQDHILHGGSSAIDGLVLRRMQLAALGKWHIQQPQPQPQQQQQQQESTQKAASDNEKVQVDQDDEQKPSTPEKMPSFETIIQHAEAAATITLQKENEYQAKYPSQSSDDQVSSTTRPAPTQSQQQLSHKSAVLRTDGGAGGPPPRTWGATSNRPVFHDILEGDPLLDDNDSSDSEDDNDDWNLGAGPAGIPRIRSTTPAVVAAAARPTLVSPATTTTTTATPTPTTSATTPSITTTQDLARKINTPKGTNTNNTTPITSSSLHTSNHQLTTKFVTLSPVVTGRNGARSLSPCSSSRRGNKPSFAAC